MDRALYIPELTQEEKIDKILKCQCINCGGHLETKDKIRYVCQYCGTQYSVKRDETQPQHFVLKVVDPRIITLGVELSRDKDIEERYGKELSAQFLKDDIVKSFSKYMKEHFDELVDIEEDKTLWRKGTTYRATMRMLEKIGWV